MRVCFQVSFVHPIFPPYSSLVLGPASPDLSVFRVVALLVLICFFLRFSQEYGGGSEGSRTTELGLRGRILDQAQRFLLTLVVHDPSRRAKCAEEALRHGLSLGSERRQWLFDYLTASASASAESVSATIASGRGNRAGGGERAEEEEDEVLGEELASDSASSSPAAGGWGDPSPEALEAGGNMLFEEVRAAAPGGYFGLRGNAAGAARNGGDGNGAGGDGEETLDWAFEKAEADRVAKGTNTDLVLLEVVMVMLKEQVNMFRQILEVGFLSNSFEYIYIFTFFVRCRLVLFDEESSGSALRVNPSRRSC